MGGRGGPAPRRQVKAVTAWEHSPVTVGMEGLFWDPETLPQAAHRLQDETLKRVDSDRMTVIRDVIKDQAVTVLLGAAQDADLPVEVSVGQARPKRAGQCP